jgi:hypothetical protein
MKIWRLEKLPPVSKSTYNDFGLLTLGCQFGIHVNYPVKDVDAAD